MELHRHVFKPNERPRLQLLALRYGVAVEDIRAANGLQDPSAPVNTKNYLYIPRRRRVVDVQKRTSAPCTLRAATGQTSPHRLRLVVLLLRKFLLPVTVPTTKLVPEAIRRVCTSSEAPNVLSARTESARRIT